MSVKIKDVISALEQFAPLPLQEDFDNAGLQVGLTEADVSGALLCLDVTEEVLQEAISRQCNLIVSHHPLIFRPLRRVAGHDFVQRIVMEAIRHDITIVSMHTNLDNAPGGVNFKIAEKLQLHHAEFFARKQVEMIEGGSGVVGMLPEPMTAEAFIAMVKSTFRVANMQTNELLQRPIQKVAVCGGAGAFLLREAIAQGADAFITGEMHYHDFFDHGQQIQICVIGHYESEHFTPEIFQKIIQEKCGSVVCHISAVNTNPIIYL